MHATINADTSSRIVATRRSCIRHSSALKLKAVAVWLPTMSSKADVESQRQFKASVPVALGRRKPRRKPKAGSKDDEEPIANMPQQLVARAVAPYSPRSELEDSYLRFLIYHCMPPALSVVLKQSADSVRRHGSLCTYPDLRWSSIRMVPFGCSRRCLLPFAHGLYLFPRLIPAASRSAPRLLLSQRGCYSASE